MNYRDELEAAEKKAADEELYRWAFRDELAFRDEPVAAPDLLPELHDVPLTDLDTDRDTERRAEERDRRWEELNARD